MNISSFMFGMCAGMTLSGLLALGFTGGRAKSAASLLILLGLVCAIVGALV